jgi:8-oxo-dGTP diphosphatase
MVNKNNPRVGVGVIIMDEDRVLLGRRTGAHGAETWCPPGGHLEFGEDLETCAIRETLEETGIHITSATHVATTNDVFVAEEKHYITLFMLAAYTGEPVILMEPQKCVEWLWFDWNDMPTPLFLPIVNLLEQGFHPKQI